MKQHALLILGQLFYRIGGGNCCFYSLIMPFRNKY